MPRGAKILLWIGCGFGALVVMVFFYAYFFGAPFFLLNRDYVNDRAMLRVPVALPDLSITTAPGMKLAYFGWEFEVPWNDLDPKRTRTIGMPPWQWQLIGFRSGRLIAFIRHPAHEWLSMLHAQNVSDKRIAAFEKLFGPKASSSEYEFMRAALETTPDQLTPFTLRREAARLSVLLLFKRVIVASSPASGRSIFLIDTGDFRGFQFGNPQGRAVHMIDDQLFTNAYTDIGGVEFRFHGCPPDHPITQAEINRVIQTVHRVDVKAAAN